MLRQLIGHPGGDAQRVQLQHALTSLVQRPTSAEIDDDAGWVRRLVLAVRRRVQPATRSAMTIELALITLPWPPPTSPNMQPERTDRPHARSRMGSVPDHTSKRGILELSTRHEPPATHATRQLPPAGVGGRRRRDDRQVRTLVPPRPLRIANLLRQVSGKKVPRPASRGIATQRLGAAARHAACPQSALSGCVAGALEMLAPGQQQVSASRARAQGLAGRHMGALVGDAHGHCKRHRRPATEEGSGGLKYR